MHIQLYGDMIADLTHNGTKQIGKKRFGRFDVNVYADYAHILLRDTAKLPKAAEMLHNAVLIQPDSAPLRAELGELLLKLNEPLKAVKVLHPATYITDSMPEVFSYLGTAYSWLGHSEEAVNNLNKALKLLPNNYQVMMTLAYILHQSNESAQLKKAAQL